MIGEVVGSYRIVDTIGQGGMGVVYRAEHTLIGRKAAVKVLLPEKSRDTELVERFFNEARTTAMLQHPGLVEVFDFGHHASGAYIVMELLEGESLSDRLTRDTRLPIMIAAAITRQVASALHAAHQQGIVHRDLKPQNIQLIDDDDAPARIRVKVLDFGIAKLRQEEAPRSVRTATGAVFGTPRYMSPEQCKSASTVDARTDIYALGCIFFEMLTGVAPFDYDSWGELVAAHIHEAPPCPTELDPHLPDDVDEIVARSLAKKLDQRYASMAELALAIEEMWPSIGGRASTLVTPLPGTLRARPSQSKMGSLTLGAGEISSITEPLRPVSRRRPIMILAVATVAASVAVILFLLQQGDDARPAAAAAGQPSLAARPEPPSLEAPAVEPPRAELPSVQAPPPPAKVELVIDSLPRGAEVFRAADGVKLGTTPLTRSFERTDGDAVFLVKLAGYQNASVSLSTTADGTRLAKLTRLRVPKRAPVPPKKGGSGPTVLDPYGGK